MVRGNFQNCHFEVWFETELVRGQLSLILSYIFGKRAGRGSRLVRWRTSEAIGAKEATVQERMQHGVGIFSFVETEGLCGGGERTRQLYGQVLPRHPQRRGLRGDALKG